MPVALPLMPTSIPKIAAVAEPRDERCEHTGARRDDCACPACVRALVEKFCRS